MKKVSVIIPVYGVEPYIAATVQSVLEQTYSNLELLIIDDESPDRSIEICQQFTDPRIKIIHQQNRGLAGARNTGIRHAEGAYLAFLDGDDLWLPNKLKRHIEHLETSPQVGISFSRSALIDPADHSLNTYLMPKLKHITIADLFTGSPIGNGSAAVIRREAMEAIQFQDNLYGQLENFYFDEHFRRAEDMECWLRIAILTTWKFEGIPEALTLYRVNAEGLSANLLKQFAAWEQVLEKIRTYAPALLAQYERRSRAYCSRYLARNAIRLRDSALAVQFMHQALRADWQILREEPSRTLRIWLGAYLLWLLPSSFYQKSEAIAAKLAKKAQEQRISQDQSRQLV